ncbi:wd40 repeat protein [Anaeramoeba flamelloides]|uniref:Wd40 repeat protein n=1 Tax=Anaeramoeba flamelloides TaxID=1746091 RepID=A0ABQ8XH02_9EUKA|nr:wd40 repeat protein [Anaeramoeba flamelloides]
MKSVQTFRGHKCEVSSISWSPINENFFVSGGANGSIIYWATNRNTILPLHKLENGHDGYVWDLAWHPLGHILCSSSNDNSVRFWGRMDPEIGREKQKEKTEPSEFQSQELEYEEEQEEVEIQEEIVTEENQQNIDPFLQKEDGFMHKGNKTESKGNSQKNHQNKYNLNNIEIENQTKEQEDQKQTLKNSKENVRMPGLLFGKPFTDGFTGETWI